MKKNNCLLLYFNYYEAPAGHQKPAEISLHQMTLCLSLHMTISVTRNPVLDKSRKVPVPDVLREDNHTGIQGRKLLCSAA